MSNSLFYQILCVRNLFKIVVSIYHSADVSKLLTGCLYFLVPPEVEIKSDRMWQYEGRSTVLQCTISAYPLQQNEWLFNGRPLDKRQYIWGDRHEIMVFKK